MISYIARQDFRDFLGAISADNHVQDGTFEGDLDYMDIELLL